MQSEPSPIKAGDIQALYERMKRNPRSVTNQGRLGSSVAHSAIAAAAMMSMVNRTFIPYGTAKPPKAKQEPVVEAKPSIPIKQRRKMLAKALRESRSGVARAAPFFCREILITNGDSK